MKVREVIRLLQQEGWYEVRRRGSHRQFKHPLLKGRVTVSGALGDELPIGTLRSVFRQAGMRIK